MAESLDANKKQIVEYIIKNSPYGETAEVIQGINSLITHNWKKVQKQWNWFPFLQ